MTPENAMSVSKRVYIETTIPSYLAAWPSRDIVQAARQQLTHDWWNNERLNYDLCASATVLDEAAAERRLHFVENLPLLDLTDSVNDVAKQIMESGLLPPRAARDAIHIAIAAVHGVDLLLTWNCKHIANAAIMKDLTAIVADCGYDIPVICTPEELLGD
jgi:predicted nucleic acid-binding protein